MTKQLLDKKLQTITDQIVREYLPDQVILFGSWVWGTPHADSDVDLVVIKDSTDSRQLARSIDGALFPRPFPIDIVVYRPEQIRKRLKQGDQFISQLMTNGKVLYAKKCRYLGDDLEFSWNEAEQAVADATSLMQFASSRE